MLQKHQSSSDAFDVYFFRTLYILPGYDNMRVQKDTKLIFARTWLYLEKNLVINKLDYLRTIKYTYTYHGCFMIFGKSE